MKSYKIHIQNYRPPSLNDHIGKHWSVKRNLKNDCMWAIHGAANNPKTFIPNAENPRELIVTVYLGKGERPYDEDNQWKVLLDALKTKGNVKDYRAKLL